MSFFVWGSVQVQSVTLEPSQIGPSALKEVFLREGVSFTREEWQRMVGEVKPSSFVGQFPRVIVFVDGEPTELTSTTGYGDPDKPLTVVLKAERPKT